MEDTLVFIAIFSGTWGLMGVIFLAVGLGLGRAWRNRDERMRATAEGTVLEVIRHSGNRNTTWRPLVSFQYEGRDITLEGDGMSFKRYYEGQPVTVRYDPDDPACFAIEGASSLRLTARIFTWVGAGCLALAVIVAVALLLARPGALMWLRMSLRRRR